MTYDTIVTEVLSQLRTRTGLPSILPMDDDTLDALAASDAKTDDSWFYQFVSVEPSIEDLNDNRMRLHLLLCGAWSTSGDARQTGRVLGRIAKMCRTVEVGTPVDPIDFLTIEGEVAITQRFKMTTCAIPLSLMVHVEA